MRAVVINRKRDGNIVAAYRVVDNPQTLTTAEWDRVVAVFVAGPEWQFRSWPMLQSGGTIVDVFTQGELCQHRHPLFYIFIVQSAGLSSSKLYRIQQAAAAADVCLTLKCANMLLLEVRGFHCKWEEDPVLPAIKQWDVALLEVGVSPYSRASPGCTSPWTHAEACTRSR